MKVQLNFFISDNLGSLSVEYPCKWKKIVVKSIASGLDPSPGTILYVLNWDRGFRGGSDGSLPEMWEAWVWSVSQEDPLGKKKKKVNPLQYSCLENSRGKGTWQATVHGVTKSWSPLSGFRFLRDLGGEHKQSSISWRATLWQGYLNMSCFGLGVLLRWLCETYRERHLDLV